MCHEEAGHSRSGALASGGRGGGGGGEEGRCTGEVGGFRARGTTLTEVRCAQHVAPSLISIIKRRIIMS